MSSAVFPGSFNPFTVGHASIVERALGMFDTVYVAVGHNAQKNSPADTEKIVRQIETWAETVDSERIKVVSYSGELTADLARRLGCSCLLRGVRSVKDFEYERDMADINRRVAGLETVLLFALPDQAAISSSVVRELASYGYDIKPFLP